MSMCTEGNKVASTKRKYKTCYGPYARRSSSGMMLFGTNAIAAGKHRSNAHSCP